MSLALNIGIIFGRFFASTQKTFILKFFLDEGICSVNCFCMLSVCLGILAEWRSRWYPVLSCGGCSQHGSIFVGWHPSHHSEQDRQESQYQVGHMMSIVVCWENVELLPKFCSWLWTVVFILSHNWSEEMKFTIFLLNSFNSFYLYSARSQHKVHRLRALYTRRKI